VGDLDVDLDVDLFFMGCGGEMSAAFAPCSSACEE